MKFTSESTISEVLNNPVGYDVAQKVVYRKNMDVGILSDETFCKKTLGELLTDEVTEESMKYLLDILNANPEKIISKSETEPEWWKEAVIYQIYPRSFMDSDGDGVGDLQGIISKLDYLKDLGVDVLWLSPIYDSPNDDMGYDIRDYQKIMTEFGTMDDFDKMLDEIHKRGMKLIMDLVVNHTSDEHEWFRKALAGDEKYKNYYFFRKGKGDGVPPNNWKSFFSGSAWNYYPELDEWALHLFSSKQMDLNWDNPELRQEVYDMVSRWLEKGVDGFRMDVITLISKTPGLPDGDPTVAEVFSCGAEHYSWGPKLHEYLSELNEKTFKNFPGSFCVAEPCSTGIEMVKLISDESRGEVRQAFLFDHIENPGKSKYQDYKYNLKYFKEAFTDYQFSLCGSSWPSFVIEYHDNPRMVSKVNPDKKFRKPLSKLLGTMVLTGRGTPYIFQGEELGMMNCDFKDISEIRDVEGINRYNENVAMGRSAEEVFAEILAGGRDNARTPIPWDDSENAGFTTGTPWLRVNGDYKECNVKAQLQDETSPFNYYKKLMALRKENKETLVYGDFIPLETSDETYCFYRVSDKGKFYIEMNLTENETERPEKAGGECVLSNYSERSDKLRAYEVNIYIV